ncbi:MAG: fibronectin type III-like domain-contianing protein [Clostridiales bacterium]|nr:fibronectin type III-like domain-contianing protein [Clostridiales bacterium]
MDIDRIRGLLSMMRLSDKTALTGGGISIAAMDRPKIEKTDFGDCVMPYYTARYQLALGCSFSREFACGVAKAMAFQAAKKRAAFGGAVRGGIIRDPMSVSACEFFSEDQVLTSELLKCFDGSNGLGFVYTDCLGQGAFTNRTVDKRTLYELYLYPLVKAGENAAALQLDGGYLNGENVCLSREVADAMTRFIKNDAMLFTQYRKSAAADGFAATGNCAYTLGQTPIEKRSLVRAVENGEIMDGKINRLVERTLATMVKVHDFYKNGIGELAESNMPDFYAESSVLLKNDGVLPCPAKTTTVFGDCEHFEDGKKYALIPIRESQQKIGSLNIFLISNYEEQGIPQETVSAIMGASAVAPTVAVLCGACATPVTFADKVNALMFCPGVTCVSQVMKLLTYESPSGRLPFTWCKSKSDYPSVNKKFTPRGDFRYESVYNGYALFNNFSSDVLYPFGHGLDYTEYAIGKISVKSDGTKLHVEFDVKNVGDRAGTAVCQAYISLQNSTVYGLTKRLAAFERVHLERGESKHIATDIDANDFAVYDENNDCFVTVGGKYTVEIGLSSRDIRAHGEAKIAVGSKVNVGLNEKIAPSYYAVGKPFEPAAPEIEKLLKVPFIKKPDVYPDLMRPSEQSVKKQLKRIDKTAPYSVRALLRYKILTTPERNRPE